MHVDSVEGSATFGEPVYQPFAAYRVKPFGGDTIRLFAGFWDTNGDGHWSCNMEVIDGEETFLIGYVQHMVQKPGSLST